MKYFICTKRFDAYLSQGALRQTSLGKATPRPRHFGRNFESEGPSFMKSPKLLSSLLPGALAITTMPLKSDIQIDAAKFHPFAVSEQKKSLNQFLLDLFSPFQKWYEVGTCCTTCKLLKW
jgi:hypothetical protein